MRYLEWIKEVWELFCDCFQTARGSMIGRHSCAALKWAVQLFDEYVNDF